MEGATRFRLPTLRDAKTRSAGRGWRCQRRGEGWTLVVGSARSEKDVGGRPRP
jgi:hypothetical protein